MNKEIIDVSTHNLDGEMATVLIIKHDNAYNITLTYLDDAKTYQDTELGACYLWAEAEIKAYGHNVKL